MYRRIGLVALALASVACSRGERHEPEAFVWQEKFPAGTTLRVRNGDGNITVRAASGTTTRIVGAKRWKRGRERDVRFATHRDGRSVYVCAMWRGSGHCGDGNYRGKRLTSFWTMFSLFNRSTDASADFVIEVPANIRIDARTTTGEVSISGARAGVSARNVNGPVSARDAAGPINLTSTNGDIELSLASLEGADSLRLSTTNGDVSANLPADLEGKFDLSTVNGSVRTDFPLTIGGPGSNRARGRASSRIEAQLGTSNRYVRMRTTNGSISLNRVGVADSVTEAALSSQLPRAP